MSEVRRDVTEASRGQCYGSALSVQLDFSGKHELKIANQRGVIFGPFIPPGVIAYECLVLYP